MTRNTTSTRKNAKAASTRGVRAKDGKAVRPSSALVRLFRKQQRDDLRWWYELGCELLRLYPEPQPGEKRSYRTKTMAQLGQELSGEQSQRTANTLWLARRLASRFSDWPELQDFAEGLSTWHVIFLSAVHKKKGNKSSMKQLQRRCIAGRWSEGQLKREIQNDRGRKSGSGGLPKPKRPATAAIAIKDLYFAARRWMIYHDQCLAGRRPLLKNVRRADYSPSLLRDVEETVQWVQQVEEAVKDELRQLRELRKKIESALKR
jgi:hypothetical protein